MAPSDANAGATQIRISGFGGQGVVLAGILLGKAASLYDGKEAVFTQSHGPEARGGASSADVIISKSPVDYPLVTNPDILVALFQEAYVRFRPQLKENGVLIVEQDLVQLNENDTGCLRIPATRIATNFFNRIVTNVVMLGYMVGKTGIVGRESLEQAIRSSVPAKALDMNLNAFAAGYERAVNGKACHE